MKSTTMHPEIKIDPEFRAWIPVNTGEVEGLESDILADGVIFDPLKVWEETGLLLDGHNRFDIATKHGMAYLVHYVSLPDREAAFDWMDRHALNKRNTAPDVASLIRGRIYNRAKKTREDNLKQNTPKDQIDPSVESTDSNTSANLAPALGVSSATLKRDGAFAEAAETLGITSEITKGEIKATKPEVIAAAKALPPAPTAEQKAKATSELKAPKPKPTPTPKAKPSDDTSKLHTRIAELEEENADLINRLEEMRQLLKSTMNDYEAAQRTLDAEDLLGRFDAEIRQVNARSRAAESQNAHYMLKNAKLSKDLIRAESSVRRLTQKLKGVEVTEPEMEPEPEHTYFDAEFAAKHDALYDGIDAEVA